MVTVRTTAPPPPFRRVLQDGTRVLFRAILPSDEPILRKGLRQLSYASRYGRFHSGRSRLSSAELRYLTNVDYRDHMAWLAFDVTGRAPEGLAVGRYVRLEDEPKLAEVAITVCDGRQGCGLGTLLFDALARVALRNGIDAFRAYVLAGNDAALRLARRFGAVASSGGDQRLRLDAKLRRALLGAAESAAPGRSWPAAFPAGALPTLKQM